MSVSDDPKAALAAAELVIDFTPPAATLALLRLAAERGARCVVGTTGSSAEQRDEMRRLAGRTALVLAPNFSVA